MEMFLGVDLQNSVLVLAFSGLVFDSPSLDSGTFDAEYLGFA